MVHTADWYIIFVFCCSLLGLMVSGILFFANRAASFPARLLAGFLTSLSLVGLNNALMATNFFSQMPHLWRAVAFASFLPAPFSYLYVRSALNQEYRFRSSDWWFFIPSVLYVLTMLPFYLQPTANKLELINRIIQNNDLIAREPENLLPPGISTLARTIYGLGTSAAMIYLLYGWKDRIRKSEHHIDKNMQVYHWLILFTLLVSSLYAGVMIAVALHLTQLLHFWEVVAFTISLTVLFVSASLMARPSILYGLQGWIQTPVGNTIPDALINSQPIRRTTLSPDQGMAFRQLIDKHFHEKLPFRKPQYKIADMSKELGIPIYQLSGFINQQYGKNFNEFVNDHRVNFLADLLLRQPEYHHYTLEALSREAGFNSRNAFIASVKRKTGKTPSEYFGLKES